MTVIVICETEFAQGALEMVQANTLVPTPKPFIAEDGEVGLTIVPIPETNVHDPVPTAGIFAVIAVLFEEMQRVWFDPDIDVEGTLLT